MTKPLIRLSKLMSEQSLCSRREADEFISKGWVFVNGEQITELGFKTSPEAQITLDPKAKEQQKNLITIALNKPVAYVSNLAEKDYIPAIRLIKPKHQDTSYRSSLELPHEINKLAVIGRLDIDSKGLLIFTQDGRLAKKVIGADSEIEKEYLVTIKENVSQNQIDQLSYGLSLDGKKLKPAIVRLISNHQLQFILKEGKKRQIRRMCEQVQLSVISLIRVRIGTLKLGRLKEGQWRFIEKNELNRLMSDNS